MLTEQRTSTVPCKNKQKKTQTSHSNGKAQTRHTGFRTHSSIPGGNKAVRVSYRSRRSLQTADEDSRKPTFNGAGGGQVTSPWALRSPVSLKLGWDPEERQKTRKGGQKKNIDVDCAFLLQWILNKETRDTDVRPPLRKNKYTEVEDFPSSEELWEKQ